MNIQIFGTMKCKDTAKAFRFFKERNIKYHFVDLSEKGISKGELQNIANSVGVGNIIDIESKEYFNQQLKYKIFDEFEEILVHPLIVKSPIVRNQNKATLGYEPEMWENWLKISK